MLPRLNGRQRKFCHQEEDLVSLVKGFRFQEERMQDSKRDFGEALCARF